MKVLTLRNLSYTYPKRTEPALQGLDLEIRDGEYVVVAGASGSGKSTLARIISGLAPEFYGGTVFGTVERTGDVGMVFQDPEKQLVMETVEREVAFPLENRAMEPGAMKKEVLEVLSLLGIWHLRKKKTYELSGGEKQKVAIAAALAGKSRFLVLDEPVSQLDPMAADEIMHLLKKLNDDLGFTIVLIEQRTEKCLHDADRVVFLEKGILAFDGNPEAYARWVQEHDRTFLPPVADFFSRLGAENLPLCIKEGRRLLRKGWEVLPEASATEPAPEFPGEEVVRMKKVAFAFKDGTRALASVDLSVEKGEALGIIGANGAGKSTALRLMAGLLKPESGALEIRGLPGYLSQEPNDYLFNDTVAEELLFTQRNFGREDPGLIDRLLEELDLSAFRQVNPRDLSGGERQRAALASVLAMDPEVLLLDEPTRGLNQSAKHRLAAYLERLRARGKTLVLVTHDMEFAASVCGRIAIMFDGEIAQEGSVREVLGGGLHFTTDINRLFHGMSGPLEVGEAVGLCRKRKEGGP